MESPLFADHFRDENWSLVYFDALREAFLRRREKTEVEALFGQKLAECPAGCVRECGQMLLDI
jgi:hypothetical protein